MTPMIECPRESDVLDALASKRWPHRVDRELVDHVAACEICEDVLAVAAAIGEDREAAWHEASIPSSGQVWWRAGMRARQEAIREASRPLTFVYVVAASVALALMTALGWFAWPTVHDLAASIVTQKSELASPLTLPLLVALGALLVVAPVALYFVLSDE
jgi:lysylphosphatidylglycerol synthetase-like protein (DUF2156 family)